MTEIRQAVPLQIMWLKPADMALEGFAFVCSRCGDIVDRDNIEVHRQHHETLAEMLEVNKAQQHAITEMRAQLAGFRGLLEGLERGLKALTMATDGAIDELRKHTHEQGVGGTGAPRG